MLYRNTQFIYAILFAFLFACGCSGGGSPAIPPTDVQTPGDAAPPGGGRDGAVYSSNHICLGIYEINLNRANWTSDVTLKRQPQWHADVTDFLFPPFCPNNDCLVIANFAPWVLPDSAQFDGIIKHPFPDPNLDGFDVRGIGIFQPKTTFPSGEVATGVILNPDGYTRLWNTSPYVSGSDINPFRAYWTINDADQHKRRFEGGKSDSRQYIVQFPPVGETFQFDLAIDASYEFPDLVNPDDPLTSPNCWEPFEISATITGDLLETPGNQAQFDVYLFDWQNNPSTVTIESPDLFNGSIDLGEPIEVAGYRYDYQIDLANQKGAPPGDYPILLKCVDGLNGQDPSGLELIAYNIFTVNVKPYTGPKPPVAKATADKESALTGELITFDASESFDPDGQISTYAWDLDEDGSYDDAFDAITSTSYSTPGEKCVDVMVTDNDGLTDTLDEKLCVTVSKPPNDPPVSIASANTNHTSIGGYVKFTGDKSYDPDGTIEEYSWDFDGDYSWGDSFEPNPVHQFNVGGVYFVWLKVTDDGGESDINNSPITIDVSGANIPPIAQGATTCDEPMINKIVTFTSDSEDPDGFIMKWEWNFDDGSGWADYTSTEGLATHVFTEMGTFNVDLRVTDSSDATDTLDAPLVIQVGSSGFEPPAPYDCSGSVGVHIYQIDLKLDPTVDHTSCYDICPSPNGNWLLASKGKLVEIDTWGSIINSNFHTFAGLGPMLLSIDFDKVNKNIAYIYGSPFNPVQITVIDKDGNPVQSIPMESLPKAVCFDWDGNLWVLDSQWEVKVFIATDDFQEDPCLGYLIEPLDGRVFDMAIDFRNHGLYIFSQGLDCLGQLVKINHDGTPGGSYAPVFNPAVGYSSFGDIIIDNSGPEGTSDCRIEVFGGDTTGVVARFDSELNLSQQMNYSFWGIKAACLLPDLKIVIALEACCGRYFDRYVSPADW